MGLRLAEGRRRSQRLARRRSIDWRAVERLAGRACCADGGRPARRRPRGMLLLDAILAEIARVS